MKNSELVFDGREFVLVDPETGEELGVFAGKNVLEDREEILYQDDNFEVELDEETLKELEENAIEFMDKETPEEVREALKGKMAKAKNTSNTFKELKDHYMEMQAEADRIILAGDGGEDKTNPDYYRIRNIESIDLMELRHGTRATMAFCLLTYERYEYRAGFKLIQENNQQLDMDKGEWYLDKYQELYRKLGTPEEIKGLSNLL